MFKKAYTSFILTGTILIAGIIFEVHPAGSQTDTTTLDCVWEKCNSISLYEDYAILGMGNIDENQECGRGNGIIILDISDITSIKEVASLGSWGSIRDAVIVDTLLYAAAGRGGLQVINLKSPRKPIRNIIIQDTSYAAYSIGVYKNRIHLGVNQTSTDITWDERLIIYEQKTPEKIIALDSLRLLQEPEKITFYRDRVFYADGNNGMCITDAAQPQENNVTCVDLGPIYACDLAFFKGYAFVAGGHAGLHLFKYTEPDTFKKIDSIRVSLEKSRSVVTSFVSIEGHYAYVGIEATTPSNPLEYEGVAVFMYDISDPRDTQLIHRFESPTPMDAFLVEKNRIYIVNKTGLDIFEISEPGSVKINQISHYPAQ